jgi:hypothetical protein
MKDIKALADFLHNMCCEMRHETDMTLIRNSNCCVYYLEESVHEPWEKDEHKFWLRNAKELMERLGCTEVEKVAEVIITIFRIHGKLAELSLEYDNIRDVFFTLANAASPLVLSTLPDDSSQSQTN